ncbi:hypothetical protein [Clostridium cellulovorans]|uniref:Uncharacterized protein n=1 Tax=Clostridium cellulovorans (strain ATCC 35296 / DSM 3052 / OCM 3 / 743B) TaxID=573061 RepID=D9SSG8_CLOC7|nr:hypothetical protein [Clostridium cellulovorans]ADL50565.1 hypothetical protein Clocel_0795 [Clostridium cellulovorans 743B]
MSKDNKSIEQQQEKEINPTVDKDNYLVQVIVDGKVIKEVIALNSTINIVHVGNQSLAADVK